MEEKKHEQKQQCAQENNKIFFASEMESSTITYFFSLNENIGHFFVQWNLDLRKPNLRKDLDLRKIVSTTNFLVHKLFDLRKIF